MGDTLVYALAAFLVVAIVANAVDQMRPLGALFKAGMWVALLIGIVVTGIFIISKLAFYVWS